MCPNPRPTGTPDFPLPTGGGGGVEHPRLSRLLLVVEKNGKKRSKARQKGLRNYFSQFFAKVKIMAPRAKKWQNFRVFLRLSNIVSENLYYFGNYYS